MCMNVQDYVDRSITIGISGYKKDDDNSNSRLRLLQLLTEMGYTVISTKTAF